MARKIRLTESDLHNIICESVENILSELDWKTNRNAARKSFNLSNNTNLSGEERLYHRERGKRFGDYADEQFCDKYGCNYDSNVYNPNTGKQYPYEGNEKLYKGLADKGRYERGGYKYEDGKYHKAEPTPRPQKPSPVTKEEPKTRKHWWNR